MAAWSGLAQILAQDPENFGIPLLAPRGGKVNLNALPGHITLEDLEPEDRPVIDPQQQMAYIPRPEIPNGEIHQKLMALGAWSFFHDAHTQKLPDPKISPAAIIVSTIQLEPFLARGNVLLKNNLEKFTKGLEHLQSLLEYQPIYLIVPDLKSDLVDQIGQAIRGRACIKAILVKYQYPLDHFAILARELNLKYDPENPVWGIRTEGVLAAETALTQGKPATTRIISLGGPAVSNPTHYEVCAGYPISQFLEGKLNCENVRLLNGGSLTGEILDEATKGIPLGYTGITVLEEPTKREMLSFTRPGADRQSYSNCFLSALRKAFPERITTSLRGEKRPCIACGYCEEICPVGIMPHLIHKLMYRDELERAEQARADRCIGCGLCSFVCPSKIDLRKEILEAQDTIQRELHSEVEEADE